MHCMLRHTPIGVISKTAEEKGSLYAMQCTISDIDHIVIDQDEYHTYASNSTLQ